MSVAVTVKTYTMEILPRLNGSSLYQGDRIDNYQAFLVGRSAYPTGHPLKSAGFLTAGYTTTFVAKTDPALADDDVGVISATMTPVDEDTASLLLLPGATSGIDFGYKSSLLYQYQIQISDGADSIYTLDWGTFHLIRDVALTP